MASITCYGGVNEIGGNKILVKDKDSRIFLDFGQSFSHLKDYFVEYLQPRNRFGLRDYFALDLMPSLKGLYNKWALEKTGIDYCEPAYQAVFISHPHYDHISHLRFLDENIPVHMGETAKSILGAANETSKTAQVRTKNEMTFDGDIKPAHDLRLFRTGDRIKVGSIEIEPVHVDHSAPGAYGFIVYTSEGILAYTGDIRRHGSKPEMTADFIRKANEAKPDLLVIEGTRVAPEEKRLNFTEPQVYENSLEIARKDGIVLAMRYPKDLDRFKTFYKVAKETGRKLVVSTKTAHLLTGLQTDRSLALPDPFTDDSIEIYKREMKIYPDWERLFHSKCVDWKWVKENQKKIIWELDFFNLTELIDVHPEPGFCIHSMSEPFEEDPVSQVQDEVMKNWMKRFSLEYHQLHASGHSSMNEIFEIMKEVDAKKVVPVHTNYPELFIGHGEVVLPEYSKEIQIK